MDREARLIAVAPDLLEALKQIVLLTKGLEGLTAQQMQMRGVSPVRRLQTGRDIAATAIAKVESA